MDGLALLCNLHADGPLTLRRLRDAGVRTLRDVDGFPAGTLARWLGGQRARRFVDEARQLAARLAETALEAEESAHSIPPAPSSAPARHAFRPAASSRTDSGELDETTLHAGGLVGLDAETAVRLSAQGVRTHEALVERASLALARRAGVPYPRLLELSLQAQRKLAERAKAERVESTAKPALGSRALGATAHLESEPLRAGALEGLDEEACQRLSAQGVRTFAALAEETDLSLARRTGIPYPRLLDLAAQAWRCSRVQVELRAEPPRRRLALEGLSIAPAARSAPAASAPAERTPRRSWSNPPEREAPTRELAGLPEDPGVAGPFQ